MINFLQPFSFDLNIGKAYNEACKKSNGWICITDQDTLKFEGFAQKIKEITEQADKTDVITCMTNRLNNLNQNLVEGMYEESDINKHFKIYNYLWDRYGPELEDTKMPIAGVFMLFHKSVWDKVKFVENSIQFDSIFTEEVKKAGFKTKVAKGLYIFHLYRWGRNVNDIHHLLK